LRRLRLPLGLDLAQNVARWTALLTVCGIQGLPEADANATRIMMPSAEARRNFATLRQASQPICASSAILPRPRPRAVGLHALFSAPAVIPTPRRRLADLLR
jgi:hypothetical protein